MSRLKSFFLKLHYALTLSLAAFPVFPLKITSFLITLWTLVSIFAFGVKPSRSKKHLRYVLLFSSMFLLYAISLLWTKNEQAGVFNLEKNLSLLTFPVTWVFIPFSYSEEYILYVKRVFIYSCFSVTAATNCIILINGLPDASLSPDVFSYVYRTTFEQLSNLHPTYMCMLSFFAVLLQLDDLLSGRAVYNWAQKTASAFVVFILVVGAVLLAARLPLFAFVMALLLFLYLNKLFNTPVMVSLMTAGVAIFISAFIFPSVKARLSELTGQNLKPPVHGNYNSVNLRAGIYECSWQLIKEHWMIGIPPGDLQNQLNNCYAQFNTDAYKQIEYNSHNEYLNKWLCFGIVGIVLFLLGFILPFIYSLKNRHYLYTVFIVFFALCCFTENLLSRQMGVVFYAFFNSLFLFNHLNKNYN